MSKAVRFERYGGIEVLEVVPVDQPSPGRGDVLVEVRAAGINPGEAAIREGRLHEYFPATFPSGQGSDLAGVVTEVGEDVGSLSPGDEVLGYTDRRASHASHVAVPATQLVAKPDGVTWEEAGALKVAGATAHAANEAVGVSQADVVVVAGAAGGVGSLAVQLARLRGAEVIGLAGGANHPWLAEHGVVPLDYHASNLADRVRTMTDRVDAFLDLHGGGYVRLATELGVSPKRINTIIDFDAAAEYGTRSAGESEASSPQVLAELAEKVASGALEVPIARTYPLDQVREAYEELERRHTRGKIVLVP